MPGRNQTRKRFRPSDFGISSVIVEKRDTSKDTRLSNIDEKRLRKLVKRLKKREKED